VLFSVAVTVTVPWRDTVLLDSCRLVSVNDV
jgi:hypothetical protein